MRIILQSLLILFMVKMTFSAFAQPVISHDMAGTSDISTAGGPRKGASYSVSSGISTAGNDPPPFQIGLVEIRPHMEYRVNYGDGIQAEPGSPLKTAVHELSPGVFLKIANNMSVDYTGTQTLYSRKQFRDSFDHAFRFKDINSVGNWLIQVSQDYSTSSAPLIETARQTEQENANTLLSAGYPISTDFSIGLTATQDLRFLKAMGDSFEWATIDWLNYQPLSYLETGLGAGTGYVDIISSPNMSYDRYLGKVNIKITQKLSLNLDGGVEIRRTNTSGSTPSRNPVYNLSVIYHPFEHTTLSARGGRLVAVSVFNNQANDTRSWNLNINQRLLGTLNLAAGYGEQKSIFLPSDKLVTIERIDKRQSINLNLSTTFRKHGSISASYSRNKNNTNQSGYGFTSNQLGFVLGIKY